ncbi:MAG TPA: pyrroloquinoline quinone biosynthesis peptide chaperone PqqD [Arenibaculum sp.]|nr:pyrroloquinoline quinone biosynthesis peptide chaperone PqqD [Arenibaculum sp.]
MNEHDPAPGAAIGEASAPALPRHVRLRHDEARGAWVLLAPERVLMPDEIAVEILKRCDGTRRVAEIVDDLCAAYDAPRDVVAGDVLAMLRDLADKGMIRT